MRFLHTADLHLGLRVTRFGGKNSMVQAARLDALQTLVDRARGADFTLIAGDLFDDNHVDAATSRRAFELLGDIGRPVYIIPGNHDPLTADSVYSRPPWNRAADHVQILRTCEPISIPGGALFPCPLVAKNSLDDPTRWIPPRDSGDRSIRIGLAHGSLKDRANLPADDHLIERFVVDDKGLDYLALGHWHAPSRHEDRAGVERTVYPGVHEPMGFRDSGWVAYSSAGADLFNDDGRGGAVLVTIDQAGAAPVIEDIETGCLEWREESRTLRDEAELSDLIDELARRPNRARQLLRLHLDGALPASALLRLDELDASLSGAQGGILSLYAWADLDTARLHAEPTDAELRDLAGGGVVKAVYERLKAQADGTDMNLRERARQSLLMLYRFAKEAQR